MGFQDRRRMKVGMYANMLIPRFVRNYTSMDSTKREDVKEKKKDAKIFILPCAKVLSKLNVRLSAKKAFISKALIRWGKLGKRDNYLPVRPVDVNVHLHKIKTQLGTNQLLWLQ